MLPFRRILCLFVAVAVVNAQGPQNDPDCTSFCVDGQIVGSFPHAYPGLPNPYYHYNNENRKAWQEYYRVDTRALPNVTQCEMPSSYAGNVPVNRNGNNNTLFYWALEHHPGSLTDYDNDEPWLIWLNGGPGTSSMVGLFFEHGPCKIKADFSLERNPYALVTLADVIYVDQPVGVGYGTANVHDYVKNSDQAGVDFINFLRNLVEVFPALRRRQLYITGESYAGKYIPIIAKTYFETPERERPVNLKGIVIGDGTIGSDAVQHAAMVPMLQTYPQMINYDPSAYNYFVEQTRLCGYDVNVTFPQHKPIPTLQEPIFLEDKLSLQSLQINPIKKQQQLRQFTIKDVDHASKVQQFWDGVHNRRSNGLAVRSLPSSLPNGTINRDYDCLLLEEVIDFATNFTPPWAEIGTFDPYYIPDGLGPEAPESAGPFLNDNRTVKAIHAPTSKCWIETIQCGLSDYPWAGNTSAVLDPTTNTFGDSSPAVSVFYSELAANCSEHDISIYHLDGNSDLVVSSASMLIPIQNTTFGGIRGFSAEPGVAWYGPHGDFAGVILQERGFVFIIFVDCGHLIGQWQPERFKHAFKEFILGNNPNGSFGSDGKLIGQEYKLFNMYNLPALYDPIFTGSGTTQGSTFYPSATIAAWESFIKTATVRPTPTP